MNIGGIFQVPYCNNFSKAKNAQSSISPISGDSFCFSGTAQVNNIDFDAAKKRLSDADSSRVYFELNPKSSAANRDVIEQDLYELLKDSASLKIEDIKFENYKEPHKYYDLPEKFAIATNNKAKQDGTLLLVEQIPEIFKGVDKKELSEKLDLLGAFLEEGKTNTFTISKQKYQAQYKGAGAFGTVYEISKADGTGEPVAYKYYRDPSTVGKDSSYGETLVAQSLTRDGVCDTPKFYLANPVGKMVEVDGEKKMKTVGAWQISEFITPDTPKREGKTFSQWCDEKGLYYADKDKAENTIGNYIIDVGSVMDKKDYKGRNYRQQDELAMKFGRVVTGYHYGKDANTYIKELECAFNS